MQCSNAYLYANFALRCRLALWQATSIAVEICSSVVRLRGSAQCSVVKSHCTSTEGNSKGINDCNDSRHITDFFFFWSCGLCPYWCAVFFFFFGIQIKGPLLAGFDRENTVILFIIKFVQQSSLHFQAEHKNFQRSHLSPESN